MGVTLSLALWHVEVQTRHGVRLNEARHKYICQYKRTSLSQFWLRGPSHFGMTENMTQRFTAAFGMLRVVKLLKSIGTILIERSP